MTHYGLTRRNKIATCHFFNLASSFNPASEGNHDPFNTANDALQLRLPALECRQLLILEVVRLIDLGNAGASFLAVVQQMLDNFVTNAEALQLRGNCAPQIVEPPRIQLGTLLGRFLRHVSVEAALELGPAARHCSRA